MPITSTFGFIFFRKLFQARSGPPKEESLGTVGME